MVAFAAAWLVTMTTGVVFAQTVVVQNAPAGATGELILNGTSVAKAPIAGEDLITLTATTGGLQDTQMLDALVWVDECGSARRIVIMGRGETPPPSEGCRRVAIQGVFLFQRVTSMLVDLGTTTPTVRVRQGPLPEEWLRPFVPGAAQPRFVLAPTGLILFGGGGLLGAGGLLTPACGNVAGCASDDRALAYTGGIGVWFSPYVGVEGSYIRPAKFKASGSGDGFTFNNEVDGGALAVMGKAGIPVGRVRIFGGGGMDYHRATFTTNETLNGSPITMQWRTEGWAPIYGGGLEVWFSGSLGMHGEFTRMTWKGDDVAGSEATTDTALMSIFVGVRVRLPIP